MTKYIDDLIRPLLVDKKDIILEESKNSRERINDNERDFNDYNNIDVEEITYCCGSCRKQVNQTDGKTGFCEFCECEVFVDKI
jgi:hypothetical protein